MFRLRGISETIRESAPPVVTDGFAALTNLGDPFFLLVLLAVYYWLADDRDNPAQLVAFALLAVAVTVTLKNGFALPRPPADVQAIPTDADSFGFPSGHAIGATVVYGGLVAVDDRLRRRGPALALLGLAALVGLSRVVIGVHYLGDVLAGFAVGAVVLAGLWVSDSQHRPLVAGVATVVGVAALFITEFGSDAAFVFGGSLGASVVFAVADTDSFPTTGTVGARAALVALGLLLLGGAYGLAEAVGHPLALVAGGLVMLSGSLLLPVGVANLPISRFPSE